MKEIDVKFTNVIFNHHNRITMFYNEENVKVLEVGNGWAKVWVEEEV
jgi:hypothetical protein